MGMHSIAAVEKLTAEKNIAASGAAKEVAEATAEALIEFCKQSEEFAAAVVNGGSFEECCVAITKKVGRSISDLEVYRRAVAHYMPGADVRFKMEIVTNQSKTESKVISLSLADYL